MSERKRIAEWIGNLTDNEFAELRRIVERETEKRAELAEVTLS